MDISRILVEQIHEKSDKDTVVTKYVVCGSIYVQKELAKFVLKKLQKNT